MSLAVGVRLGPYKLLGPLGAGGMGEIYKAKDTRLGREVAIKVLPVDRLADEGRRRRFVQEAQAASALNHPNICTVYEIGTDGERAFIAMEHVDGPSVAERTPLPMDEAFRYGVEAADALAHAHDRGVVHGDLKAANVMIASTGRLKIVDFGLARRLEPRGTEHTTVTGSSAHDALAGTPYAMAPEQVRGAPADPLSDIWALGVLLFEMVAGAHPFRAPTVAELFSSILRDPPAALPDPVPHVLRNVIEQCLSKDRGRRYQRASDVRLVLEAASAGTRSRDATLGPSPRTAQAFSLQPLVEVASSTELVGRTTELAQLADTWARVETGRRELVLVAGEPGMGKTSLALAFAQMRAAGGATVLVGRHDREALVPYQAFVEALGWFARVCPQEDLHRHVVAMGGGAELVQLIPDLLRREPDLAPTPAMSPESQRYRLFEAVAEFLALVAAHRPVLLILEDLHWADKPSLLLLRHILRAQRPAAICIVGTYRETELDRQSPLAEMLPELRREPAVSRVLLGGFSESAVRGVVARTIGGDTRGLARALWEVTSGNPLFVGEMLRHLQESGGVERVRRSNTLGSVADLGLPERIRDVIDRRLSRTSDQCHQVLALGAVIGREFEVATVEPLADLPHDELLDTLDEACAAHLIEETPGHPGRFSFLHALIRETLYAELSPSRRRRLHQRVGEAMERLAERKPIPPLADLAYHFFKAMSAESADKAVDYATRAGDRAADALASEEAARFYAMALDALELSDGANLDTRRIDLHTRRARAFGAVAQWALEKEEVLLALQSVSAEQIERRAELLLMLADSSFYLLDVPGVRRFAEQALQLAEQVQRSDVAADALGWVARCDQADGDLARAMQTDRAAILRGGGRKGVAIYHGPLTLYLAGATVDAVTAGQRAAELARTSGDAEFVMYALSHYGLSLGAAGRYREAKEIFEEVRRFGRRYGVLPPLARATAMQAGVHLAVYDLDGAETLQHEALELARSLAFTPTIVSASIDLLFTMARRHNPGSAGELLAQTTATVVRTPGWHEWLWTLRLTQARAELALAREEFGDAVAEATTAIHQSRARGRPKYEALGLLTRALARQRLNQTQDAIADAHRAVAVAGDTSDPALQLRALRVVLDLDGSDALALVAQTHWDHIHAALPNESMRVAFATADALKAAR